MAYGIQNRKVRGSILNTENAFQSVTSFTKFKFIVHDHK